MLEIGGPTPDTTIYNMIGHADNVVRENRYAHFSNIDFQGDGQMRVTRAAFGSPHHYHNLPSTA